MLLGTALRQNPGAVRVRNVGLGVVVHAEDGECQHPTPDADRCPLRHNTRFIICCTKPHGNCSLEAIRWPQRVPASLVAMLAQG